MLAGGLLILLAAGAPEPAGAQQGADDREPVGWPLRAPLPEPAERPVVPPTPVPDNQPSEITEGALDAWSAARPAAPPTTPVSPPPSAPAGAAAGLSAATAEPPPPPMAEIAPLDRFLPPIEPISVVYAGDDYVFGGSTGDALTRLAARLRGSTDRVLITAHSGDDRVSTHDAVKLSLTRALIVRQFLVDEGVEPDQIDVDALPQADDDGPRDRVDIAPIVP